MKILILFFISFKVCASWEANVNSSIGESYKGKNFYTKIDAQAWVSENSVSFGPHTVVYKDMTIIESQNKLDRDADKLEISRVKNILNDIQDHKARRAIKILFKKYFGK